MTRLLHTADLHLKAGNEKPYCFAVLDEIIALAGKEKAGFLIIAGDLFDSFSDFEALRGEVCLKLKPLAYGGCRIIYIPGNHEARGAAAALSAYDLSPLTFCAAPPFALVEAGDMEFLCVPHCENYDGYRDWAVPPKKPGVTRVAVLHALNSTVYTGPEEEADSKTGVIEDEFFFRFGVDYAAMGHLHSGRQHLLGGAVACYPGSPRVWRAHSREAGPKTVRVVETGVSPVSVRAVEIKAAGQYREYFLPVELNGVIDLTGIHRIEAEIGVRDLVDVKLTGVVEDEKAARAEAEKLRARLAGKVRLAEVGLETKPAVEISSNSLAKNFLAEMEAVKPAPEEAADYRRWLLARQYGLEEIAAGLGGAK